ncbi:hypothetical protein HGA64_04330 [Candidatus Falkowbacteria bacterium]|nr:hypothetical protein [Candidatus Falkowbacteria bacterium]
MEIKWRLPYPAGAVTNFATYFFFFDDVLCASMEGFLQSLLTEDQELQEQVCMLTDIEAKKFGLERIEAWRRGNHMLYWRGKAYDRHGYEYQKLLDRAYMALFTQNESYRKALWDTGTEVLTHSIGVKDPNEDIMTEEELCSRLIKLRDCVLPLHLCDCSCHEKNSLMMHCVPCCHVCEICGKNIKPILIDEHMRICHDVRT